MSKKIVWNKAAEDAFRKDFSGGLQEMFDLALKEVAAKKTPAIKDTPHGEPFGNEVWKLKAKDQAGQWRVVYVRPYEEAVYVLNRRPVALRKLQRIYGPRASVSNGHRCSMSFTCSKRPSTRG